MMNRLFIFSLLLVFVIGFSGLSAQEEEGEFIAEEDVYVYTEEDVFEFLQPEVPTAPAFTDVLIPGHIRNNQYFLESVHYTNMAQAAYEEGDYDASIRYSQEAIRFARLSDEFVALQLKIKEADDAIAAAEERMEWADSSAVQAQTRFPDEYKRAELAMETAVNFRRGDLWDNAIVFAYEVINELAYISEIGGAPVQRGSSPLPAQYTVRDWGSSGDCLWNIAGRPWAYGDPDQWELIYDANRSKLSEPNNPNLIEPGMVLDIPSMKGETRQGMWSSTGAYTPLE